MIQSEIESVAKPDRVVVLGSRGMLGHALVDALQASGEVTTPVVALSSQDVDLLADTAARDLVAQVRPGDAVVMLSGLTPDKGRDSETLLRNLRMANAVGEALTEVTPAQLIYMSSDAVYPFAAGLVNENSPAAPSDLYGVMHLAREVMLQSFDINAPLAILRCTLVFSSRDTHNSYGSNRFRKQAREDGRVVLGGGGEETRDHVLADDVGRFVLEVIRTRFSGTMNVVSGVSHSFFDVANMVAGAMDARPEVVTTDRSTPITHRHYDTTKLGETFPSFRFTPLDQAILDVHQNLGLKT